MKSKKFTREELNELKNMIKENIDQAEEAGVRIDQEEWWQQVLGHIYGMNFAAMNIDAIFDELESKKIITVEED